MKTSDVKRIMIVHNDNDFIRAWDWLGKITLDTILSENICGEKMLEDTENIEKFVLKLLPVALEFANCKTDKYKSFPRYQDIQDEELDNLMKYFNNCRFKYNFDDTDEDWIFGGCETLIIDIENGESYIR